MNELAMLFLVLLGLTILMWYNSVEERKYDERCEQHRQDQLRLRDE